MNLNLFKIRIVSQDHGKKFQDYMLDKGIDWWSAESKGERRETIPTYIYFDNDMKLWEGREDYEDFFTDERPEKWFYDGEIQDKPCVIPALKIRITDKGQSESVQNLLFERGIYWAHGSADIEEIYEGYYLLVKDGRIFRGLNRNFEHDDRPEKWLYAGHLWNTPKTESVFNEINDQNEEPQPQPKFYPGKELKTGRETLEAQLAGLEVQRRDDEEGSWSTLNSSYFCDLKYLDDSMFEEFRIKPNLKRHLPSSELAEPLNEAPHIGQKVWTLDLGHDFLTRYFDWTGSLREENLLRRGLIYNRSDEAHKHALAIITYESKEE